MYDMIIHQDLPGTIKLKCSSKHRVPKHGPLKANGFKVRPTMCSYHVYLPCFTICHMHLPYLFTLFYHGFTMVLPCFTMFYHVLPWFYHGFTMFYHKSDHSPPHPTCISLTKPASPADMSASSACSPESGVPGVPGPIVRCDVQEMMLKRVQQKMDITWLHDITLRYPRIS
jgi:hypothetical protein